MQLTRRHFAASLGGAGLTGALPFSARLAAAVPGAAGSLDPAIASIAAYADQHRRFFNLPSLTLGLAIPGGAPVVRHFGYSNLDARTPVSDRTLFEVGSISKLMTASVIHQLAREGRLKLGDQVASLLPTVPLPAGDGITVQNLLDHNSGLPGNAPIFGPDRLWTGFKPGTHWNYSNTGYELLGKIAEKAGGKPLARLLDERLFTPLGMRRTFGAITFDTRADSAQGYEPVDTMAPFVRGAALVPAAFVDVTFGAGCVLSNAADMTIMLHSVAAAAQGKGGLGLSPVAGKAFSDHHVPSDRAAMRYGNGLMHVGPAHRYIHHTGGMVSFSSAMHVDPVTGFGAFASTSLTGLVGYRPSLLTLYAVQALEAARAGRPVPSPPALSAKVERGSEFVGDYSGPAGAFSVKAQGTGLVIAADGEEHRLEPKGTDTFATLHPRFRKFSLWFERPGGKPVQGVSWGSQTFIRKGSTWSPPPSDPKLALLAGRYVSDSPWVGGGMIVERHGKLWLGTSDMLYPLGGDLWRIGDESWSPERVRFDDRIDGRPQSIFFSGEKLVRHDI